MPERKLSGEEGPFEGSRCVAGPGGQWGLGTIRRVNEDGTFKIEFDVKEMLLMPYWYGVTTAEISFNDARQWRHVFAQLNANERGFTEPDFLKAITRLGFTADANEARQ